jgi:hypothetical protein
MPDLCGDYPQKGQIAFELTRGHVPPHDTTGWRPAAPHSIGSLVRIQIRGTSRAFGWRDRPPPELDRIDLASLRDRGETARFDAEEKAESSGYFIISI